MDKKTADSMWRLKLYLSTHCSQIRYWMVCTPDEISGEHLARLTYKFITDYESMAQACLELGTENSLEAAALLDASSDVVAHYWGDSEIYDDDKAIHQMLQTGYRLAYEACHESLLKVAGRIWVEVEHWRLSDSRNELSQQTFRQTDFNFESPHTYKVWAYLREQIEPQTYDMIAHSLQIGKSTCCTALKELYSMKLIKGFPEGGALPIGEYRRKF